MSDPIRIPKYRKKTPSGNYARCPMISVGVPRLNLPRSAEGFADFILKR